jgi:5'(3')-deoxyribonucleotidase
MRASNLTTTYKTDPIVYVDMDNVLADFFGKVADEHDVDYWREIHRKELGIDQVAQKSGFFRSLKPMPNAEKLIAGVLKIAGKYSILSSPLLSNVEESSKEKTEWLQHYLKNRPPQAIIFDHEKFKYAKQAGGTPNILIDDYDLNIHLWESNGGIGILYDDKKCKDALRTLHNAINGTIKPTDPEIADDGDIDVSRHGGIYTSRQVLKYVTGIHNDYHMPEPILAHKIWLLKNVAVSSLKSPEYVHQDDPYRRVIDIDWDHVKTIKPKDVRNRPIVVDENGWVLDGNHRVAFCMANGIKTIPALIPYLK